MFSPLPLLPLFRRPCVTLFVVLSALGGPFCLHAGAQAATEEPPVAGEEAPPEAGEAPPAAAGQAPASQNAAPNGPTLYGTPGFNVTPLAGGYGNTQRQAPEVRRAFLESRMRDLMQRLGLVSVPTQDAILAFMNADEDGKRQVREAGRKLLNAVRLDAPPERLKALLADYQNAINADQVRRERAQTALNAQIGYSLNARLESLLWLLGVLGQGQSAFGPGAFASGGEPIGRVGSAEVQASEIAGIITNKSGAGETSSWLEIRDESGRLWRLKPDALPAAREVLGRQINALPVGAHITVRVGTPVPIPVLLAIVPDEADTNQLVTP